MKHESYTRIVPGSDTAVLFLHGILGTPRHFKDFIPLVPYNWTISAPLLPGHGGSTRDFSKSSMAAWKKTAEEAAEELLRTHKRIFIVAHSMGTLFAIRQALKKPQRVQGLFLLAAPLKLGVKPAAAENMAKLYFNRIREEDLPAIAARDACSISLSRNILVYLGWAPRYLELFREIRTVRKLAGEVKVPVVAFQSVQDELVSRKAAVYFGEDAVCRFLPNSRHYYYAAEDREEMLRAFSAFLGQDQGK